MNMKSAFSFLVFSSLLLMSSIQPVKGAQYSLPSLSHQELPLRVPGPESIAFDCNGAPHVGVADGVILKWYGSSIGWREFAVTAPNRSRGLCDFSTSKDNEHICGRPLGLKFDLQTCELYIADAYFGLMKTGPNGGVAEQLATSAEGVPFRFLNGLDINGETGMVYFTDTSTVYERSNWQSSVNRGDRTGRLLSFDPSTKKVSVLIRDLSFPNGVALSQDGSFVLVTQTTTHNVLRIWLQGSTTGAVDEFFHTQGAPDNIVRNINGDFWIAENDSIGRGKAVKIDVEGTMIDVLDGLNPVSHVEERDGNLWLGSVVNSFVGVVNNFS